MTSPSNGAASPFSEAERALRDWGIAYEKRPGGTLFVPGDIFICNKGLTRLPCLP
jgi:hypothetical protein